MAQVTGNPVVVVLTKEQVQVAAEMQQEYDDCIRRATESRNRRTEMLQDLAGAGQDWKIDKSGGFLIICKF